MKKTAILLLCCGMFMSVVGCGGNTSPLPTESPPTTAQPKEESKPTVTENPTELSTTEISKPTEETLSNSEESQEEIYVGIEWPEVDTTEIKKLVIEKTNAYRANELTTTFSHTSNHDVCKESKYVEFVDMTLYGITAEDSYYQGCNRETIGMGDWFDTAESMSDRIADGFHHSKGHWVYVGSSEYPYIAVGVTKANGKWYVCVCMSEKNYGD